MTPIYSTRRLYFGLVVAVLSTLMFGGLLSPVGNDRDQAIAVSASRRLLTPTAGEMAAMSTDPAPLPADARYGRLLAKTLLAAGDALPAEVRAQQPVVTRVDGTAVRVIRTPSVDDEPLPTAGHQLTATGTVDPNEIGPRFPIALPPDVVIEEAPPTLEERGEAAYQAVGFDLEQLGYAISFHGRERGYLGMTFLDENRIEIYAREVLTDADLEFVVAHEIGHAVDHIRNSADDRMRWREARGAAPAEPWWPANEVTDWGSLAGDFAECFASWLTGKPSHHVEMPCDGTEELIAELAAPDPETPQADDVDDGEVEDRDPKPDDTPPAEAEEAVDQLAASDDQEHGGSPERP